MRTGSLQGRSVRAQIARRVGRRPWTWLMVFAIAALSAYVWGAGATSGQSRTHAPGRGTSTNTVPVVASAAKKGDIGVYLTGRGTVTALNTSRFGAAWTAS